LPGERSKHSAIDWLNTPLLFKTLLSWCSVRNRAAQDHGRIAPATPALHL
jgi:hypothetical protein